MNLLESLLQSARSEFLAAVERSRKLHRPWAYPPATQEAFHASIERLKMKNHLGYWVCTEGGELAGVINVSEIVRGNFCSAYVGFYAFTPHNGHGHMKRGLRGVLDDVFSRHRLHRIEANIQPGNARRGSWCKASGFRLEGLSPRYLKIGGRWRDHESWAITAEEWKALRRGDYS